jgi:cellulose synthase/poly-beta-1,6-N-acetylglucosamine synthase-like glycosyltransferase/peptidoglycan/xylan/chitin deacetylase (PgdA/CDA1 family)
VVVGLVTVPVFLITGSVVAALWRAPDGPGLHLPLYQRYDLRTSAADSVAWHAGRGDGGPPVVLVLAVAAVVVVTIGYGLALLSTLVIHRRGRDRRSGRWWVAMLVVVVVAVSAVLAADRYTEAVVARDTHVADGHPALAPGTGAVLEVRADGVRSARIPAGHVALTFDDGPDPRWTPAILAVLARESVVGTFFVIGEHVVAHPELVRRMIDEGDEVGVHTYRHLEMSSEDASSFRRDLRMTQLAIIGATGRETALFRPPFISDRENVGFAQYVGLWRSAAGGYVTALADRDSTDWSRPGVDAIVRRAMPRSGAGAVIELHDGGGDRSQTVAALTELIRRLKHAGYTFDTVGAIGRFSPSRVMPVAPIAERIWGRVFVLALGAVGTAHLAFAVLVALAALLTLLKLASVVVLARRSRRARGQPLVALDAMPSVSVIVAAYQEEVALGATLRSLCELRASDLEIVVVDDGSTDATPGIAERFPDGRVRLIRRPHAGKAAALAAGLKASTGDIVVTVDADTLPDRDAVRRLVAPFQEPRVAAVCGNLRVANPVGPLGRAQQLEYVIANAFDRRALDLLHVQVTVPGAIGAFRRGALLEVGGFDAATVAEDTDLTLALVRAGYAVRFAPEATARTIAPTSIRALWRQRSRWSFGILQSIWRHRSMAVESGCDRRAQITWWSALVTHVLLPLAAPLLDIAAVWSLLTGTLWFLVLWFIVASVQLAIAASALRSEGASMRALWAYPLHVIGYRQLTAFVVPQALAWAVAGRHTTWATSPPNEAVPAAREPVIDLTLPEPASVAVPTPAVV